MLDIGRITEDITEDIINRGEAGKMAQTTPRGTDGKTCRFWQLQAKALFNMPQLHATAHSRCLYNSKQRTRIALR
jgi:hypothetical protein